MSGSAPASETPQAAATPAVLVGGRPSAAGLAVENVALMYLVDCAGVIQWANREATALLPSGRPDGVTLSELAHVDDRHKIDMLLVGACVGRHVETLVRIEERGSAPGPRHLQLITTGDGRMTSAPRALRDRIVVHGRYASTWPIQIDQPPVQTSWDARTECANWESFVERLNHELARAAHTERRVAILFTSVHGLAAVNVSGGTSACARVLGLLTWRLRNALRPPDTLSRVGRSEFAVICPDVTDAEHAMNVADRMRAAIAAPILVAGRDVALTLSVSLAFTRRRST